MTFLKETLLSSGPQTESAGFVFTKTHALLLALFLFLFFLASYSFQLWGMAFFTQPQPMLATEPEESEEIESFVVGVSGHSANIIPFSKSPPRAMECLNEQQGRFYYSQGLKEGGHCTDQCPAPTLPDDEGHCRTGVSSP